MKNSKNIIIGVLLIVILLMAVGYSSFATQLKLNGTAEIIGEWNVRIIGIEAQDVSKGCDAGDPQFTNTSATFNAKLVKPGDYITYLITIENAGNINATLDSITFTDNGENGSPAITYKYSDPLTSLPAGAQTCVLVQVMYDENITEIPDIKTKTITGIIEYVQE